MSTFANTAMGMFKTTAMMTGNFDWLFHCDCTGLIDLSEEDDRPLVPNDKKCMH